VNGNGPLRGGIDLGGTKIQTAVVDSDGKVVGEARHPTPETGGPEDVAKAMEAAMSEAAKAAGAETDSLVGVGVGSPGDANEKTGVVSTAKNLPGWSGSFPLGQTLSEALGTEVRVGNDVQVAVEGEFHLGAGRPYQSLLGVWWGTGVGGGIVLDGKPWLGRGAAGEIGHMVVKRGGAKCPCGRRGCMEAYAGRAAMEAKAREEVANGRKTDLFKLMEKRGRDRLTSGIWERALNHGDELTEELIDRAIKALGAGIASAANLLDPEVIILGGGLGVRFGESLGPKIEKKMMKSLFTDQNPPDFKVAELGDLGGAIGASLLVARQPAAAQPRVPASRSAASG
jgi:glucokinase